MPCTCKWKGPSHHCVTCHYQFRDIEDFDAHRSRGKCKKVLDMFEAGQYTRIETQDGLRIYHLAKD